MSCNCKNRPEIGRGAAFCNCGEECRATVCEGCFKLHETQWLADYPDHVPTDIFEVRFKNTRRSFYQNVNNLPLETGDIVAAFFGHDHINTFTAKVDGIRLVQSPSAGYHSYGDRHGGRLIVIDENIPDSYESECFFFDRTAQDELN